MKKILFSIAILLTVCLNVSADYEPEKFSRSLMERAAAGDAKAQYDVFIHLTFNSVDDEAEIETDTISVPLFQYLENSANQGFTPANILLGQYYLYGDRSDFPYWYLYSYNIKEDYEKALQCFTIAAEDNDPEAINFLGYMNAYGRGTEVNIPKAMEYYKKSADMGNINGLNNYGKRLLWGEGVAMDAKQAIPYLQSAAEMGHIDAIHLLARVYHWGNDSLQHNDGSPLIITPENRIYPDIEQAIRYYTMGANQDDSQCMYQLAQIYTDEELGYFDITKAFEQYDRLVMNNQSIPTLYEMAQIYEQGKWVPKNLQTAYFLYQCDVLPYTENTHTGTLLRLAKAYLNGEELVDYKVDPSQAITYLSHAYDITFNDNYDTLTKEEKKDLIQLLIENDARNDYKELFEISLEGLQEKLKELE